MAGNARSAAQQDKVLMKLAKGGVLKQSEDGEYRLGRERIGAAVVTALLNADLLRPLANGRFDLSPAGMARARRAKAARHTPVGSMPAEESLAQQSFQAQHQIRESGFKGARNGQARVTVNRGESPLGWLRRRRNGRGEAYLDDAQVEAGERLRNDFEIAGLSPKITASWSGIPADKGRRQPTEMDPTEVQVAARQRFHKAMDALGPDLADVAVRVCCSLEGLEAVEKAQGWPVRSGKVVLAIALERLVVHYGLDRRRSLAKDGEGRHE